MEIIVASLAAFTAATLTFFTGFGLATLLTPVCLLLFEAPVAVAVTAAVHLANSLLKAGLLGRHADGRAALAFGATAVPAAWLGASLLGRLAEAAPVAVYAFAGAQRTVRPVNLVMGILIAVFAVMELRAGAPKSGGGRGRLAAGGLLSGFFGGLSGHQGLWRGLFFLREGYSTETFLGTSAVLACLVDLTRLPVYAANGTFSRLGGQGGAVAAAIAAALAGTLIASKFISKTRIDSIRRFVVLLSLLIAAGLVSGLI